MSEHFDDVIVTFADSVSKEEIDKYVEELLSAGGELKHDWYRQKDSVGGNAFSARIPVSCLETFKSLGGDKIKYIESDGIVTTQENKGLNKPVPSAIKSEPLEDLIVSFEDSVSTEEIEKHVKELELAGGKVKYYWYRDKDSIMGKAFAAKIPVSCLQVFNNLQSGGKIKFIEVDGIVTTQGNDNVPKTLATQAA